MGRHTRYPQSRAPSLTHIALMRPPPETVGQTLENPLSPWCVPETPRGPAPRGGDTQTLPGIPAQACLTQDPALLVSCPDRPRLAGEAPERAGKGGPGPRSPRPPDRTPGLSAAPAHSGPLPQPPPAMCSLQRCALAAPETPENRGRRAGVPTPQSGPPASAPVGSR